jgi:hypothetical protein
VLSRGWERVGLGAMVKWNASFPLSMNQGRDGALRRPRTSQRDVPTTIMFMGRILRMKPSRFEPLNRMTCEVFSLAPIGGEGWG